MRLSLIHYCASYCWHQIFIVPQVTGFKVCGEGVGVFPQNIFKKGLRGKKACLYLHPL
jgi:hypothetical protein